MIYEMYCIKDELSDYTAPIPFTSCETAKRYFETELENNKFMKNNKNDFSLWYIGLFNSEEGTITENMCKLVMRGFNKKGEEEIGNKEMALPNTN